MLTDESIREVWRERVASGFMYRGMSAKDLRFPLDPSNSPFASFAPEILRLLAMLRRAIEEGLQFEIVETHWGQTYRHELSRIVEWSRRDLETPSIDFTGSHRAACEYADNWQGSQLKQNLKSIAEELPKHRSDPSLHKAMGSEGWRLAEEVREWVCRTGPDHRRVVLWVRRSCPRFEPHPRCPLAGTLESFIQWVRREIERRGLPPTTESVSTLVPEPSRGEDSLWIRLRRPLEEGDVERIEQITGDPCASG